MENFFLFFLIFHIFFIRNFHQYVHRKRKIENLRIASRLYKKTNQHLRGYYKGSVANDYVEYQRAYTCVKKYLINFDTPISILDDIEWPLQLNFTKISFEYSSSSASMSESVEIHHYRINKRRYSLQISRFTHYGTGVRLSGAPALVSFRARVTERRKRAADRSSARHHRHQPRRPALAKFRSRKSVAAGDAACVCCLFVLPACLPACPGYSLSAGRYRSFPEG